ncbi:MAG: TonB-dependent receptor [Candidatus Delongbacteria bacterium]|nr:TonB-dependent receptor [Candidatus Delongbacteria bacterium]
MMNRLGWKLGVLLILFSGIIRAGTTGKIAGKVTDESSGEALPGVNIMVESIWSGDIAVPLDPKLGAATDINGEYFIINIPPGSYTVTVSMIGYHKHSIARVMVSVDRTSYLDFKLKEQTIQIDKEILVTADKEVVVKDQTSALSKVNSEQISLLPVENVQEVLNLQSGVTVGAGGDIHIRGGRSSEIAYWVDGINVTDSYDNSLSQSVENEAIQELQVISGTFNAEYGQAMSGIINIVTKEGASKFDLNLHLYGGDYLSSHSSLYSNLNQFNPIYNTQLTLTGPIRSGISFFTTARYAYEDGYLYGERRFTPQGQAGDNKAIAMNDEALLSIQNKLTFRISGAIKLAFGQLYSTKTYHSYNHRFRLNPDGIPEEHTQGQNYYMIWTHTLNQKTFYTLNASYQKSEYQIYKYENPLDSRYIHPDSLSGEPTFSFLNSGIDNRHFERYTETLIAKLDITSQISMRHQLKAGIEYKRYHLYLDEFYIMPELDESHVEISPFRPYVYNTSTPYHDRYHRFPQEASAYIQDKIEYQNFIVNAGIRLDYFNPEADLPADPADPNIYNPLKESHAQLSLEERRSIWYKQADAKYQVSPRLGIAYPITDQGTIHFSYGHFLQIPNFLYLYNKPEYKINESGSMQGVYGNPDLKPQKTTMYEIGLQQEVFPGAKLDITGFYRDVRDWISTSPIIETAIPGTDYLMFINQDYAGVKGVTLSYNQAVNRKINLNVEYTYQTAEGTNSDPAEEQQAMVDELEPTRQLVPLDWDRTHTANASLNYSTARNGITLLGKYASGIPYTPSLNSVSRQAKNLSTQLSKNSRRIPDNLSIDLYMFHTIRVAKLGFQLYLKVYNLLDRKNPVTVYSDTGDPEFTLEDKNVSGDIQYNNPIEEYLIRPDFFQAPRKITCGLKIDF